MKSEWKVSAYYCSDLTMYRVYRVKDISREDEPDNREYKEEMYNTKAAALDAAKAENIRAAERFWKGCDQ